MKDKSTIVQKIKKCYVGEHCIQVMIPYRTNCAIFNPSDIQYLDNKNNSFINKYIEDERRKLFPYHKITNHHRNKKITLVNQIYEFNKPYLEFRFGEVFESYVVKDGEEALILTKCLDANISERFTATREETEKLLNGKSDNKIENSKNHYIISDDGSVEYKVELLSERELVDNILKGKTVDTSFFLVDLDGESIKLRIINVKFKGYHDEYEIKLYEIPVRYYTYGEIKYLSKDIKQAKEPKIKTKFNKAIAREEIEQQKRLVLNNNNNHKK